MKGIVFKARDFVGWKDREKSSPLPRLADLIKLRRGKKTW